MNTRIANAAAVLASIVTLAPVGPRALAQCTEEQKLSASDAAGGDQFAFRVAVSGDTAVVGALFQDCTAGDDCGAAYVFRWNGTTWAGEQKLTASDAAGGDQFGGSVALSGDTAIIGTTHNDCLAGNFCGSAYVFRWNGSAWIEEQKLLASDGATGDSIGGSVAISGNAAVVGANAKDCAAGIDCGSAYIFRFDGTSWVEEQKLTASDAAALDFFGTSVSINGDTAIVGANGDACTAGTSCGSAYVFRWNGSEWVEEQKLTASDAAAGDQFAFRVSVSGAEDQSNDPAVLVSGRGSAYVFRFNGTSWIEEQKLTASDVGADDGFGVSVAVSGDTAVVGAMFQNCTAGDDCGAAYVFRWNGTTWTEEQKLIASDAAANDRLGVSAGPAHINSLAP